MPEQHLPSAAEDVCEALSVYKTITFVGDSFVRNLFMALLLLSNTEPAHIRCLGDNDPLIPLASSAMVSCARPDALRWSGKCEDPPPTCCASSEPTIDGATSVYEQFNNRKYGQVHTDGLEQFCGGKLRATMIRVYKWQEDGNHAMSKYAYAYVRARAREPGRHLLVLGNGIHYMMGSSPGYVARKAWQLFSNMFAAGGISGARNEGKEGRFTVVFQPLHYRRPKTKYAHMQCNWRSRDVMERIVDKLIATLGPLQNTEPWPGSLGGLPRQIYPDTGEPLMTSKKCLIDKNEQGEVLGEPCDDCSWANYSWPDPAGVNEEGSGDGGVPLELTQQSHRVLVLDTYRFTRQLIETCPAGLPPTPADGSHFKGAGNFIMARLLVNLLTQDEVARSKLPET